MSAGLDIVVAPLLDDDYVSALYTGKPRPLARIGIAYLKRLATLLTTHRYDLLWIEKELFPNLPATFEQLIVGLGRRYVVDYDDAVFHNYDHHTNAYFRSMLAHKIDRVMKYSSLVVAGNRYLAERACRAGAHRVEILPTVVDLERYRDIPAKKGKKEFNIGWIGTPITSSYIKHIHGPLKALAASEQARVILVGASHNPIPGVDVELRPWSEIDEAAEIQRFDVGIMPLPDEPWERGKCGYKLIQYMACGKPVIGSPVGANTEIIQDGVNGFLVQTEREWHRALVTLRDNHQLREEMGKAGRRLVEERYCLSVTAPRLLELLKQQTRRFGNIR